MAGVKKLFLGLLIGAISILVLSSCEEEDANNMALAQQCFNQLTDAGASAEANECLNYISNQTSSEAYALKCGLLFWQSGLRTTKVVNAFDQFESAPEATKESLFLSLLAIDADSSGASDPADVTLANSAYYNCKNSGSAGLIYLGSLTKLATQAANVAGNFNGDQMIDQCEANPASCATAENGQLLVELSEVYCAGSSADNEICESIETAIAVAGAGNYAGIISQFLIQIDPNTGT